MTAVLLLFFFICPAAVSQCNFPARSSAQFRASFLDLAIDGTDLWAATSYGVQLYDRSADPPSLVAVAALPDVTRVVRVVNRVVYAGSGTRVYAMRKNGRSIAIAGFVDAGATVNDIEGNALDLYVATAGGLQQYDLLNQFAPRRTSAAFPTTRPAVFSLAISGSTLFGADGDSTVEQYSIDTIPQHTGSIETLRTATSVAVAGSRLYVSDGQRTDLFFLSGAAATRVGTMAFPSTTFATQTGDVAFCAGTDRRLHAVDWTTAATPVELFASDVAPTGGTINRIAAMQLASGRLYVAAGDAGLLTWDVSLFAAPFPIRSYDVAPMSSVVWADQRLYASRTGGGLTEMTKSAAGNLTAARQWDDRIQTLQDSGSGTLLSSVGSSLLYWGLTPQIPVLISSATLRTTVASAVLTGSVATAVLSDGSIWTVDLSQSNPQPQATAAVGSAIARSGSAIATSAVDETIGTTTVRYFATSNLSQPVSTTLPGATTAGVALSGSTAAVFTFRGINLVDFNSGTVDVIPQSNGAIALGLAFSGTRLVELTETSVLVWDISARKLVRSMPLPQGGTGLAVDQLAAVPTSSGVMTVAIDGGTSLPALIGTGNANAYYRKVAAAGDRLYLFDGHSIDVFTTVSGLTPHFLTSIRPAGIVDFTATPSSVYALAQLSSGASISRYTPDGFLLAQTPISEGENVVPISLATAGDAVWVSISRNCLTAGCEKKTVVYDGQTLARTSLLDGATVDVTTSGSAAFAIFDLPKEVRVYGLADPGHPAQKASRATEGAAGGSKTPVSIALANGSVLVLGEKMEVYDASSLVKTDERFDAFQPDASGSTAYVDQRVYANGNCVIVSGRGNSPQSFELPAWSGTSLETPAPVRSIATSGGRVYLLTDDSVEILATDVPPPSRRRGVR